MEDTLVSFETAKLAKEKGFDVGCFTEFNKFKGEYCIFQNSFKCSNLDLLKNEYSAPTQSLLQKWLREVHNIHITLFPEDKDDKTKIWISKLYTLNYGEDSEVSYLKQGGTKITYEEALEVGLQEALKLIK